MPMHEPMTLGRWMKRLRADLDLTQEVLAEQVGCALQTIRSFELGKRRPSRELADRLAATLQVPQEQRAEFLRLARTTPTPRVPEVGADQAGAGRDAPAGTPAATATTLKIVGVPDTSAAALEHAPLLATKLYLPRPRAQLVPRPRLLARLQAGLRGSLTLIAAPAGFGKTTLLAQGLGVGGWRLEESRPNSQLPTPNSHRIGWLSLDAGDNDPAVFLRYLIAALQRALTSAVGTMALVLMESPQPPPLSVVLTALINDLAATPQPLAL
ncbi:MAG: helix-turn-helix domain-containing protein, partial [Chloroflexota bacterium]|nr:helix-turn-helix domain-containing protein [Chloroflexota bacterium]